MPKREIKQSVRNFENTQPVKGHTPRAYMDTPMGNKAQKARGVKENYPAKCGKIPNK